MRMQSAVSTGSRRSGIWNGHVVNMFKLSKHDTRLPCSPTSALAVLQLLRHRILSPQQLPQIEAVKPQGYFSPFLQTAM